MYCIGFPISCYVCERVFFFCRKLEKVFKTPLGMSAMKNQCRMENIAWMHNHFNNIECIVQCLFSGLLPHVLVVDWPELMTINLEYSGEKQMKEATRFSIIKLSFLLHISSPLPHSQPLINQAFTVPKSNSLLYYFTIQSLFLHGELYYDYKATL